jgi:hypothetical protein
VIVDIATTMSGVENVRPITPSSAVANTWPASAPSRARAAAS